jgi:hypothetical protein
MHWLLTSGARRLMTSHQVTRQPARTLSRLSCEGASERASRLISMGNAQWISTDDVRREMSAPRRSLAWPPNTMIC